MWICLKLLAADKILDVKVLIHPELLRYIQSVDKDNKVCYLCPLKRYILVATIFKINSNDVSLEIEKSLT